MRDRLCSLEIFIFIFDTQMRFTTHSPGSFHIISNIFTNELIMEQFHTEMSCTPLVLTFGRALIMLVLLLDSFGPEQ